MRPLLDIVQAYNIDLITATIVFQGIGLASTIYSILSVYYSQESIITSPGLIIGKIVF